MQTLYPVLIFVILCWVLTFPFIFIKGLEKNDSWHLLLFFLSQAYSRNLVHNFIWILGGYASCIRTIAMKWLWAFPSHCIIIISLSYIRLFLFLFVLSSFCFVFLNWKSSDWRHKLLFRHSTQYSSSSQTPGLYWPSCSKNSIDSYSRQTYAFILSVPFKSYRTFEIHDLLAWFTLTGCHRLNHTPLASWLSESRDADISPF